MKGAPSYRVEHGAAGIWLALPGFGAPHRFGTKGFLSKTNRTIDGTPVVTANQVHKDGILIVDADRRDWGTLQAEASAADADALATAGAGGWIGVTTADCLPLLVHDPDRRVVAAVHAGWRGALMGIATTTMDRLTTRFGSRSNRLEAAIGPHIGVCCFEVGRAVLDLLEARFPGWQRWVERLSEGKGYFNLRAFIREQLAERGVEADRIHAVDLCTRCEADLFSSYRREGRSPQGMLSAVRVP
ncbi:MAG: peptidoglycan editing factor PgeF [Nitrospirae bacterium]|nr:peptidoglycan editing factor PgeF [Nitrospirota bacterium]